MFKTPIFLVIITGLPSLTGLLVHHTVKDKTVQVKLTSKSSSTAIKSSCIDMNQSSIESLNNVLSYASITVAMALLVHKL
jgi:hypothetical protein